MKVPLLDLKPQYLALKTELDDAVHKVIESQYFILGPEVEMMEKELADFIGCEYTLGVSSGTDALLLALMAAGVNPGDEVIVPAYSFFATAGVVSRLNAKPVFCDINPITFNIEPEQVKEKITEKTKAIIPVHLYGQCADTQRIAEIAKPKGIYVIEDAAQAISAEHKNGKQSGTIGDIGCYSFFPSKNLGCFGDGGLVSTNDEALYHLLKIMRVHGGEKKYYHSVIGGNFRIDALQAAVLRVKLKYLNTWSEKRRKNAELYNSLFIKNELAEGTEHSYFDNNNKVLLPNAVYKDEGLKNYHIYNQYIIRTETRDELKQFLLDNGIATEIYYPVPFHLQKCFENLNYKKGDFPVSESCAQNSLALPVYPEMKEEQITYVVSKIKEFFITV